MSEKLFEKAVQKDFDRARLKNFLNEVFSFITKKDNELLSFHEVKKAVRPVNQFYKGVKSIPLENIIGSEGRYKDFDKEFLPKQDTARSRWQNVDKAFHEQKELPPIQVYQVGDIYFVKDGNHRVSVAKEQKKKYIDAEIIELKIKVPLDKNVNYEKLILKEEYVNFLEESKIDELIPGEAFEVTKPGRYDLIIKHIKIHQDIISSLSEKPLEWEYTVKSWYKSIYLPIKDIILSYNIMNHFPDLTITDLFIWIIGHWNYLRDTEDSNIDSKQAAIDLKEKFSRNIFYRILKRIKNIFKSSNILLLLLLTPLLLNNIEIEEPNEPAEPDEPVIDIEMTGQEQQKNKEVKITLYPHDVSILFQDNTILTGMVTFPEQELTVQHSKKGFIFNKKIFWKEIKNLQILEWKPNLVSQKSNAKVLTYYFYPKKYQFTTRDNKKYYWEKNIPYINKLILTNDDGSTHIYSYFVDYWHLTGDKTGYWRTSRSAYFYSPFKEPNKKVFKTINFK